jgi:dephospho-CoA kinase
MSKRPLKIGITGGIGTGKTTVTRIFELLQVPIYNADHRAKVIMQNDQELKAQLKDTFGKAIFDDESLNTKMLASIVFNDPEKLSMLNALVHPRVGEDFQDWFQGKANHPYVLKEAALMFEAGSDKQMDRVITVFSPLNLRIERIQARDRHRTVEDIENIINRQMAESEKLKKSDHIIYNDEENLLIPQVMKLHELFTLLHTHLPA